MQGVTICILALSATRFLSHRISLLRHVEKFSFSYQAVPKVHFHRGRRESLLILAQEKGLGFYSLKQHSPLRNSSQLPHWLQQLTNKQ